MQPEVGFPTFLFVKLREIVSIGTYRICYNEGVYLLSERLPAMNLKKSKRKDGRTYLSIVHPYRDGRRVRTKTIRSLGYLDELEKEYADPIAHFEKVKDELEEQRRASDSPVTITIHPLQKIKAGEVLRKNLGFAALSRIYHDLSIDAFLNARQTKRRLDFSLSSVMKLLVVGRVLDPASKKATWEGRKGYFERFDFSLNDTYRSLPLFAHYKKQLVKHLHEQVKELYGRTDELAYYDVTNFHSEIDANDPDIIDEKTGEMITEGLRKKGVAKNHVPDPLISMGLLMDTNALPITYSINPGNTNDCVTLIPVLDEVKKDFGIKRIVVVADKAMNTSDNIAALLAKKDGYVFSKSIRNATDELQSWALSDVDYSAIGDGFSVKGRIATRKIKVTVEEADKKKGIKKKTKTEEITERQVCVYSEKYDRRAKAARAFAIEKAHSLIATPAKLEAMFDKSAARYVSGIIYDEKTGEILEGKRVFSFNEERLKEEERFDGYYVISTSEVHKKDTEILDMYKGLWKIEQSFRITKTDLESRPFYVSSPEGIEGHFLTCFIALLIMRILEMKTDRKYSTAALINAMKKASGTHTGENWYRFDYRDDALDDLGVVTDIDFTRLNLKTGDIKKIVAATKKR
jgi:transposase